MFRSFQQRYSGPDSHLVAVVVGTIKAAETNSATVFEIGIVLPWRREFARPVIENNSDRRRCSTKTYETSVR